MRYRPFGRLDFQASALGFGCMRLPTVGGDSKHIDEPLAIDMLRYAIDHGVNYVDTAYPYHGGQSERFVAQALAGGYREKVRVATKLPTWAVKSADDFGRLLGEQLERLQADRIDFYLLHNLQATLWPRVRDLGVLDWLDRMRAEGRVGEVGFSFHDSYELLTEIVEAYSGWTVCQLQYNYVNEQVQAGTKGVKYAAERGLAVVVMEPLLGGCLASPPEAIQAVWDAAPQQRSPAEWALQWVWDQPDVAVVLSGMTTMAQVVENVASAERSGVGSLSADELARVAEVRQCYESLHAVPCTRCGYCMPCPTGVDIPRNLQLYNDALVFGGNQAGLNRNLYAGLPEGARASACTACRECEAKCPQQIAVSEWMPRVHKQLRR
jgi:predicted aldo/keto reductase-like oxidoreductase